jgi:excisionase family DNA binding protein
MKTKASNDPALRRAAVLVSLLTIYEVAALAKVCTHTIAREVKLGRLPAIRFNRRRIRYDPAAVLEYLKARFPEATTQYEAVLSKEAERAREQDVRLNTFGDSDAPQTRLHEGVQTGAGELGSVDNEKVKGSRKAKRPSAPYNANLHALITFGPFWAN